MDRCKAEMGRVRKEKRREEERISKKRKSQKNEDPGERKGRNVAKQCVFPMICGSGGSKSRLAKAAGAEPAGQMRDEKLHAVVAEAHFEVFMYKTHQHRTTFGSCDVEKVHAVVAQSTFRSQKCKFRDVQSTFGSCDVEKSARRCGAKMREAHFEVKMYKAPHVRATFGRSDAVLRGRRKGLCTLSKWAKREDFVAFPKTMAGVGHLKRICKDAFSVAGAVQETCSSEMLGGPGADFLRGVAFWSIRTSGLLRWFCVTGAALRMTWHQFFVAGAVL